MILEAAYLGVFYENVKFNLQWDKRKLIINFDFDLCLVT